MRFLTGLLAAGLFTMVAVAAEFPLTGDNTHITFVGSKKEGKHDGGFKKLSGTTKLTGTDPTTANLEVTIDTDSMYTDNPMLTKHLKSADFFDVKTNPKAKFVSKKVEELPGHPGIYKVSGDLTLNGKTRAISFPAAISLKGGVLHLNSDFKINRHDFGISYGKGKVHDVVALKVNVDAAGEPSKK